MLGNEDGLCQANANDRNENDSDDVWQITSWQNCRQCLERMDKHLRGHRLRWFGHLGRMNVES